MIEKELITIKNLVKSFPVGKDNFVALDNVSLEILSGEFTGLVGPSGSGKTTLLNILGSLDVPTSGEVIVNQHNIGRLSMREAAMLRRQQIGFIFQSYNLLAVHTVFENIEFPLLLLEIPAVKRKQMVMEALDWVGLTDKQHSKPPQLSGGQSQRVAIARAMVKKPSLVLADEPTANLDAANSHHILQTMQKLNNELGTTFVFATHDEKVIGYLHRKVFLFDGKVVKDEKISTPENEKP
ncbi:MAG TPA: ABC transporter ATP-binding protein [Bacteroidales bacterium]|nr:ABC transporter ATP-binding protein [Bacteroidales bacterium]